MQDPSLANNDRLSRMLHTFRMRSTFYCNAVLTKPWSLQMPSITDSVSFHVLVTGRCWLRLPGTDPLELVAGDLALVPHGRGHDLVTEPDAGSGPRVDLLPQQYLNDRYSTLQHGGSGETTHMICGVVHFDDPTARQLMNALPSVVSFAGNALSASSSIRDTLRMMATELSHPQLGGEAIATRLADILVVQTIRFWFTQNTNSLTGWLQALHDERIGRALEALHKEPGGQWNLEQLAAVATMSRSAFSSRFTELVGETPIAYLTRWRMHYAEAQLREGRTATQLAGRFGYQSEAAFNRAFKRVIGKTPGSVRSE